MRVTQSMLTHNTLRNLSSSYNNLGKYMDQLTTGKKINRPSDDPVVAMKGMDYRTQVNQIEQFERNIGEVHNWMDNSDSSVDKVQKALERLRELAVQGANGTYEEGQRGNIASEVDQLKEHMLEIANTKVNNKFIFSGTATTGNGGEPPHESNEDGWFVNEISARDVRIAVSDCTKIRVNDKSENFFHEELFQDLSEFSAALRDGGDDEAIGEFIGKSDARLNNNVNVRADIGARQNS